MYNYYINFAGVDLASPGSEKFLVDSKPTFIEQYMKRDVRYPPNANLLEEINSTIKQQFDKVNEAIINKIASLNQELQKEVDALPKKHDIEEIHDKHAPKVLEDRIKQLRQLLEKQQAIHAQNSNNLKLLQENINHQNKVLFSVFFGFIMALLSLCLYNVPIAIAIPIIAINLYVLNSFSAL